MTAQRDQAIGKTLAAFGARCVIARWNGKNESLRPMMPHERIERWRSKRDCFTSYVAPSAAETAQGSEVAK
jgi:hypothetical protein